jgi:3-oxoacyl-[acyl-carrier protein] reductase
MTNIAFDFSGRTVIVTGAARGIGLEVSRFFSRSGANVAMVDRDGAELDEASIGLKATVFAADVCSTADVEDVVASVMAQYGNVDVLVNNAGILRDNVVWKLTDDDWDTVLAVHAGGTFRFTRACVPHFPRDAAVSSM